MLTPAHCHSKLPYILVSKPMLVGSRNGGNQTGTRQLNQVACFRPSSRTMAISKLTKLMRSTWGREPIPKDWFKSVTVLIYRKVGRSSHENHRRISLLSVRSKLLTGIILCWLSSVSKRCMSENQADSVNVGLTKYSLSESFILNSRANCYPERALWVTILSVLRSLKIWQRSNSFG